MHSYRHKQIGWYILVPVLLAVGGCAVLLASSAQTRPWLPWVTAIMVVVLPLFGTLTVTVSHGLLICQFGLGLIRKRILLSEVRSVEAVRNPWWYGWGIHLTPHGWLWNVSGLDAIELKFASGRTFRLGSDQPAQLLAAIRAELATSERGA